MKKNIMGNQNQLNVTRVALQVDEDSTLNSFLTIYGKILKEYGIKQLLKPTCHASNAWAVGEMPETMMKLINKKLSQRATLQPNLTYTPTCVRTIFLPCSQTLESNRKTPLHNQIERHLYSTFEIAPRRIEKKIFISLN